jgi:phosphoribosyl 1,2-cyclic phosphodiesterase
LLDSSANWLEAFTPADLLVTHISHGNTREDLDSIASLVEQKLGIEVDEDTVGSKLQYIALSAHPPEPT